MYSLGLRQGDEERLEMEDSQAGGLRNNESWNMVTEITQKKTILMKMVVQDRNPEKKWEKGNTLL